MDHPAGFPDSEYFGARSAADTITLSIDVVRRQDLAEGWYMRRSDGCLITIDPAWYILTMSNASFDLWSRMEPIRRDEPTVRIKPPGV